MKKQKVFITLLISIVAFLFGINIVNAAEGEITLSKSASKDNLVYGRTADVTLGITSESFTRTDTTDIIIVLDRSTSMNYDEETGVTPMADAKKAANELVSTILTSNKKGVNVGVVTYGYTYLSDYSSTSLTNNITTLKNTINSIPDDFDEGGTNIHAGLKAANDLLKKSKATNKMIVFLSDGVPNRYEGTKGLCKKEGNDECGKTVTISKKKYTGTMDVTKAYGEYVKKQGIKIYTIGFNFDMLSETNKTTATDILNSISSGADYRFEASGYENLKITFQNLAKRLTTIATVGVVTDIVPEGFTVVENSLNATSGTAEVKEIEGKTTIIWSVGNISSSDNPVLTYKVAAKPNHYGSMYTNESAKLEFKPVDGNPAYPSGDNSLDFPMPVVPIPSVTQDDDYGTIKQGESKVVDLTNDILENDELVYKHIDENAQVENKIVLVYDDETNGNPDNLELNYTDGTFTYTSNETILGEITYKYYVESYVTINGETTIVKSNTSKITINVVKYPTTYVVYYYELNTNIVLHEAKSGNGYAFEDVTENAIDIHGYNKIYETEKTITLASDATKNVINFYYVKRADLAYTVNYLELGTNEVLHEAKNVENQTFGTIINSSDEIIEINGYNYDSVDKDTLTITTGENVINIYYTKKIDLGYTVNYLELDSNIVLHDAKKVENKTFGEVINATEEIIEIEGYNYHSIDKETLEITTGENVINIYYTKNIGTVRAIYVDTNGNILADPVETEGMVGTEYKTYAKEIEDYELFKVEGEEVGKYTEELIEVVYIYQYVMGEGGPENEPPTPEVPTGYIENNNYELLLGTSGLLLGALIIFRKRFI